MTNDVQTVSRIISEFPQRRMTTVPVVPDAQFHESFYSFRRKYTFTKLCAVDPFVFGKTQKSLNNLTCTLNRKKTLLCWHIPIFDNLNLEENISSKCPTSN